MNTTVAKTVQRGASRGNMEAGVLSCSVTSTHEEEKAMLLSKNNPESLDKRAAKTPVTTGRIVAVVIVTLSAVVICELAGIDLLTHPLIVTFAGLTVGAIASAWLLYRSSLQNN